MMQARRAAAGQKELAQLRAAAAARGSSEVTPILRAASQGRVERLLVARDARLWGSFNEPTQEVHLSEERQGHSEHLGNRAAIFTLRFGGRVMVAQASAMPDASPLMAQFRY